MSYKSVAPGELYMFNHVDDMRVSMMVVAVAYDGGMPTMHDRARDSIVILVNDPDNAPAALWQVARWGGMSGEWDSWSWHPGLSGLRDAWASFRENVGF